LYSDEAIDNLQLHRFETTIAHHIYLYSGKPIDTLHLHRIQKGIGRPHPNIYEGSPFPTPLIKGHPNTRGAPVNGEKNRWIGPLPG